MPWLTPAEVREEPYWPTCGVVDDPALTLLLTTSRIQCEAFAPTLVTIDPITLVATTAEPPENYRMAQALQARALYRSSIAGSGDQIGGDGLSVTVFPLDWTVKALLRPKRGVPVIA